VGLTDNQNSKPTAYYVFPREAQCHSPKPDSPFCTSGRKANKPRFALETTQHASHTTARRLCRNEQIFPITW